MTESGGEGPDGVGTEPPDDLRHRAEARLKGKGRDIPEELTPAGAQRLLHEMQVHEIELELQQEELRRSREELEAERSRFVDLYDFAPNGYVTLNSDGALTRLNLAAAQLFRGTRSGLTGRRLAEFVAQEDRPIFRAFLDRVFVSGEQERCEVAFDSTGEPAPVVLIQAECTADGNECRASLVDISERRAAEATLRLRDRAILAISQGFLIADADRPDLPILSANPAFEQLTGYHAGEVIGKNCRMLQGEDTDPEAVHRLGAAIERGEPCTVEILNYRKDGTPFWNALSITPVRDDQGVIRQFVGVMEDVTDRRAMERALRKAQRMEAVGHLAGGIAHDFNNLLTIINGYSDLLQAGLAPGDPQREVLREIADAGARAAFLTRQLLAYSRQQVLDLRVFDVRQILKHLCGTLDGSLGDDITLHLDSDGPPLLVKADQGQLEQVLLNLTENARDAMPEGGTLTIHAKNATIDEGQRSDRDYLVPGPYVLITVTDTGKGMDAATQASIFDPFFTTKPVGVGTGLGLSMVYGIVKQSDGFITVDSEPGEGTTFRIYLPIPGESAAGPVPDTGAVLSPQGRETVLLVEDEAALRTLVRRVLELHGYTVLEARLGEEAMDLYDSSPGLIDLLVTDVVMPGMGGRELVRRLRGLRPDLPVMYMSGYTRDEVLGEGLDDADVLFLQKPFSPGALARRVRDALDGTESPPGPADEP